MECISGNLTIHYETYGAGRPILMLPGRPSDHQIMQRFMEPLFSRRNGWLRLYPDLPGTGLTPAADHLATHDQMIAAMLAFIDTVLPAQRFVLAGYSYGGYLACGVVSRRATLIDGVLLCAPQVKADPLQARLPERMLVVANPQLLARLQPDFAPLVKNLVVVQHPTVTEALYDVLMEVPEADHAFNERLEGAGSASCEMDPQPPIFGGPALILTARQDHLCGYQDAWDLLNIYPRATFAVLDRAGHFVGFEQAELCQALMSEWLDRVEEAAGH
jgi:pimeloyl-ACP methyl ester carboxylesterase